MHNSRSRTVLALVLIALLVTSLFVPVVYADSHDDTETERAYQIVQGDQTVSVEPISGNESVEAFYDYRHPHVGSRDDPYWGRSFSSRGTSEYQQDDTSVLMLYEGSEGVSFVAVHDKYHEQQAEGTTGGSVSWQLTGLPDDGEWAVIDDEYGWLTSNESKDDIFRFDADHRAGAAGNDGLPPGDADALLSWVWLTGRNDGVAYRGLDQDVSIRIDPAFNEESYQRYGDQRRPDRPPDKPDLGERYNGTINDWQVMVPTDDGDGFRRISLDSLDEPVEIRSTSAPPTPQSVTLENDSIDPGESVQVSAVIENTGEVDWNYEARLTVGDTELQSEVVAVPAGEERTVTFTQEFGETGIYAVGVGHEQTNITVGEPTTTTAGSTGGTNVDTDDRVPGFGLAGMLAALVVISLAATYRLEG